MHLRKNSCLQHLILCSFLLCAAFPQSGCVGFNNETIIDATKGYRDRSGNKVDEATCSIDTATAGVTFVNQDALATIEGLGAPIFAESNSNIAEKLQTFQKEQKNLEEFAISKMPESYRLFRKIKEQLKEEKDRMNSVREALLAFSENPDETSRMKALRERYNQCAYAFAVLRENLEEQYLANVSGEHSDNFNEDLKIAKHISSLLDSREHSSEMDFSREGQLQIAQEFLLGTTNLSKDRLHELVDEDALYYVSVNTEDVQKIVFCIKRITDKAILEKISRSAKSRFAREYSKINF